MSRPQRIAVAIGLALALALSAGCARIAENAGRGAVEKATGVKVDEKSDKVTITGKDGKAVTFTDGDKKLPENLPPDFPVYQGEPEGSGAAEAPDGKTLTFTINTTDPVKTVFDWHKKELAKNGWKIENSAVSTINGIESGSILAKKDKTTTIISIGSDKSKGKKVSISVIINEKTK